MAYVAFLHSYSLYTPYKTCMFLTVRAPTDNSIFYINTEGITPNKVSRIVMITMIHHQIKLKDRLIIFFFLISKFQKILTNFSGGAANNEFKIF